MNTDGTICADMDILSNNLYLYASNNLITNVDSRGSFWVEIGVVMAGYMLLKIVTAITSNAYLTITKRDISNDMFNKSMF